MLSTAIPQRWTRELLSRLAPKRFLEVELCFEEGRKRALCLGIVCPMLPVDMVLSEEIAIKQVSSAIEIAQRWGANIVGLGGFTSIIGNGGGRLASRSLIPVTSGNGYTTALILDGIKRAIEALHFDAKELVMAVIGATGDIGSACARALTPFCKSLILVARKEDRLLQFAEQLKEICPTVTIEKSPRAAAGKADVLITVTSSLTTILNAEDLASGSIVCDASYPANIPRAARSDRRDVLIFEGGLATWPGLDRQVPPRHKLWQFNPYALGVHGCFAETLLIASENTYESCTIGRGRITPSQIALLHETGEKYGMCVAGFTHGVDGYSDEDLEKIATARLHRVGRRVEI